MNGKSYAVFKAGMEFNPTSNEPLRIALDADNEIYVSKAAYRSDYADQTLAFIGMTGKSYVQFFSDVMDVLEALPD